MRIASFNVENLTDARKAAAPLSERLDALRPQLTRLAADIICLQEVDASKNTDTGTREMSVIDRLLEDTPYENFHMANSVNPATGIPSDRHNLVVLSRWPILNISQHANDLVAAPVYSSVTSEPPESAPVPVAWDRPILHVQIEMPGGQRLHMLNLHLKAPLAAHIPGQKIGPFSWRSVPGWAEGYFLAAIKRSGQALEARLAIDQVFDADEKSLIAIAGDFNSEEREAPLRILLGDIEDTGNGRLAGRQLALLEHSLPESQRFTVIHRGRKLMLDHLLVSRPLLAHYRGIEVHNEMLGDELVAYTLVDEAPDSYHAPIVAEFDLT